MSTTPVIGPRSTTVIRWGIHLNPPRNTAACTPTARRYQSEWSMRPSLARRSVSAPGVYLIVTARFYGEPKRLQNLAVTIRYTPGADTDLLANEGRIDHSD